MKRALLSAVCETERPQLIAARERLHLSQEEVAQKLGVSKTTVYRWEKKGDLPQPLHIRQLCEFYGMPARDLGFPEFTDDVQTITDSDTTQEPENDMLDAFRRRHVLRRIEIMIWNWSRRDARYHLLQIAILAELEDDNMSFDEVMSRRDVLRSLALLPIDWSKLSVRGAVFKSPIEDILAQCAAGIVACWELRKGDELAFTDQTISKYIPTLKAIAQNAPGVQQKAAADLLAQCLLLKSTLAWDVSTTSVALSYAQEAESYCATTEHSLLCITTLRLKAAAFWYTNQWKQALHAAERAKYLLEERDRQDKQKQKSVVQPAKEPIPSLAYSYVYSGLATYQAYHGRKEDALLSLQKAHITFFAQSDDEKIPLWIDHSIGNLFLNDGSTHAHLGLYRGAINALEQLDTQYVHDATIPLSCRVESTLDQVTAEMSRDDGGRDMQHCITLWKKGMEGTKTLQSENKFNEAIQVYRTMQAVWPTEKQVKDLREHIVHW